MRTLLVLSCFLMAVLFMVIASWMQDQTFRRAARADLAAAACCAIGGLVLALGWQTVPVVVLAAATLLGASSLRLVRLGRG